MAIVISSLIGMIKIYKEKIEDKQIEFIGKSQLDLIFKTEICNFYYHIIILFTILLYFL